MYQPHTFDQMGRFIILSLVVFPVAILCMAPPLSHIPSKPIPPIQQRSSSSRSRTEPPTYYGQQIAPIQQVEDKNRRALLLSGAVTCACGACAAFIPASQRVSDEVFLLDRVESRALEEYTLDSRFARVMAGGMRDYEELEEVRHFKQELFANVKKGDRVLEIGVGSGPNLGFYGDRASVVLAVEPNRSFDIYARSAASSTDTNLEIVPGRAEEIPIDDASVDVVVGTMVLCSVESVERSLREVHRVLKPGGKFLFTEHTRAPKGWHLLNLAQELIAPIQITMAQGCHLRREPRPEIEAVFGAPNVMARSFVLSNTNRSPPWPPHFLLSPHLVGFATKS